MTDVLAHARIGLVGSGEFTPAMADIDREILRSLPSHPRVVILPTAAAGENPEEWAYRGVEHFTRLGARSVGLMVLDWSHAEDPANVAEVETADLVYFSGGKPARLLAALEGSPLWRGVLLARPFGSEPKLPAGTFDSHGRAVFPESLYLAQLAERRGATALIDLTNKKSR